MRRFVVSMSVFIALVACVRADAVIVLQYQTAASTTNATLSPDVEASQISGDNAAAGSGLTANTGSTWNWRDWDTASTTYAAAVSANDYWRWGFDVTTALTTVTLSTMDIRLDRSGTGPDDIEITASVNSGSDISLLTHDFADSDDAVDFIGVDISAIPALTTGDSVVFTMGGFNSESTAGTFDLETIDFGGSDPRSIRLEGSIVTVPEASAFLFGSVVCGVVGLYYNGRRSRSEAT